MQLFKCINTSWLFDRFSGDYYKMVGTRVEYRVLQTHYNFAIIFVYLIYWILHCVNPIILHSLVYLCFTNNACLMTHFEVQIALRFVPATSFTYCAMNLE